MKTAVLAGSMLLVLLATIPSASAIGASYSGPGVGYASGVRVWNSAAPPENYWDYYTAKIFGCELRSGWSHYQDYSAQAHGTEDFAYYYVNFCVLGAKTCQVLHSTVAEGTDTQEQPLQFRNTETLVVDNGMSKSYNANVLAYRGEAFAGAIAIRCA